MLEVGGSPLKVLTPESELLVLLLPGGVEVFQAAGAGAGPRRGGALFAGESVLKVLAKQLKLVKNLLDSGNKILLSMRS